MKSIFGIRDVNAKNHCRRVGIEDIVCSKPIVFCFSGSGTITEKEANGFCKLAESCLGDKFSSNIDFIGVSYGHKDGFKCGNINNKEKDIFVNQILLNLCKNYNDNLSVEQCCKNLSRITFFTFCQGPLDVIEIIKTFSDKLQQNGFSKEDIKVMVKSLFELSYGGSKVVACPKVALGSMQDVGGNVFAYYYLGNDAEADDFKGRALVYDKIGQFCGKPFPQPRDYESITIMVDSILNKEYRDMQDKKNDENMKIFVSEDHNIGYFKKDINGDLLDCVNSQGKYLSMVMEVSLQQRIMNSLENIKKDNYEQFSLQQLYKSIESIENSNKLKSKEIEIGR